VGRFTSSTLKNATNAQTMITESQHQNMTHKDYARFTREISPGSSKADFQHFIHRKTSDQRIYDSNVRHELNHHYKVLAYKEKELN
jgi:hypothetical protein